MALYNVTISSRVGFSTEVEAETEEEARRKAIEEWIDCDTSDMEFYDTEISEIWQD